jgi:hypothetical protein
MTIRNRFATRRNRTGSMQNDNAMTPDRRFSDCDAISNVGESVLSGWPRST